MIEMLGVLAIIGVLSIAGLIGYRYAINSHLANLILQDVRVAQFLILDTDTPRLAPASINISELKPISSFALFATQETEDLFSISVTGVPQGVCRQLMTKAQGSYLLAIQKGDTIILYQKNQDICDDENTVLFYVGDISAFCPSDYYGKQCDIYCPEVNSNCAKNEEGYFDGNKCACRCGPASEYYHQTSGEKVICCDKENPNFYETITGKGLCCANSYYPYHDKCTQIKCDGSFCTLDGKRCAATTSTTGNVFSCREEFCPQGTFLNQFPSVHNSYWYGCQVPGTECYFTGPRSGDCWDGTTRCKGFLGNSGKITDFIGSCDSSICDAWQSSDGSYSVSYGNLSSTAYSSHTSGYNVGGCLFKDKNNNQIICHPYGPTTSLWHCKIGSTECSANCSNPPFCGGTCQFPKGVCDGRPVYSKETVSNNVTYCCRDDLLCCQEEVISSNLFYRQSKEDILHLDNTRCNPSLCGNGALSFQYVPKQNLWTCANADQSLVCKQDGGYGIACQTPTGVCGHHCSYQTGLCETPVTLDCAVQSTKNPSVKRCPTGTNNCSAATQLCSFKTSNDCGCDGVVSDGHCCSEGQVWLNGTCVVDLG